MSENSASAKAGKESSKEGDAEEHKQDKQAKDSSQITAKASKSKDEKAKDKDKDAKKDKAEKPKSNAPVNGKDGKDGAEKKREKAKEGLKEKVKQREKDKERSKEKERTKDKPSESRRKDKKERDKSRKRRDSSSDSDYSRSRSRSKSRRQKKEKDRHRVSGEQASRSRDAAEARVKTLALRPPVVKPAMAPAKSAADVAREKAEFEEFCKAQAMMQARALVPAADPAKPSPVLALGNFGGRAAGQGAPGQNDQISLFCRASGVDQRAEISLRGLPVHLAAEIMAGGPLLGVNSSSVLMARIHQAEALSRTKNLSLGNTAAVQAAQASGDLVSAFIAQYGVDASAEGALRNLPADAQRQVIGEGPLRGLNASALLMSRIRRVQGSLAAVTSHPMGPGGMNPPMPAKSGVGPL